MGNELKRMRYFDGLFLDKDDYTLDQEHYRRLQHLHNRYLHTWGIAYGLEVKTVIDSNMEVVVSEGMALALEPVEVGDPQAGTGERMSREILIYDGHPDNPVDLSEYWGEEDIGDYKKLSAYWDAESSDSSFGLWDYWLVDNGKAAPTCKTLKSRDDFKEYEKASGICITVYKAAKNIYIYAGYQETKADRDNERGQGEEIHTWERGYISHGLSKPQDPKSDILLARVVPRAVQKDISEQDGSKRIALEFVIDSICIFDTDVDGNPLRIYSAPAAKVLGLEKFIFKLAGKTGGMPSIGISEGETSGKVLAVDAQSVKLKSKMTINGNLALYGGLVLKTDKVQGDLLIQDRFLQVNSRVGDVWRARDGGLEVYRGGPGVAPDARIVWSEAEECWKAGLGNELWSIVYGDRWDRLVKGDTFADDLHRHDRLYSRKGIFISADSSGTLSVNVDMTMQDKVVRFGPDGSAGELGWYWDRTFAGLKVDGPVLSGSQGGILGTTLSGQKSALLWNSLGNIGIGVTEPKYDMLEVGESLRILTGANPVRFTSKWSGFPDTTINQAEISNDTSAHKALMLVGNQSAGQNRKVAIWDRLDVNGILNVNGSMQALQSIIPSVGTGNRGIVFPADPGGGWGDCAYMQYYPRAGESCTLEIGINNDGDDHISLMPSGSLGVGTRTPAEKLDVTGNLRVLSDSNPIQFNSRHTGFPNNAINRGEISNDTGTYRTLMILGNQSAGMGRRVSIGVPDGVPDSNRLDVNGKLFINGTFQVGGAIVPTIGNSESRGIMFPKDPYGGSGDSAWIRYYSDPARGGGENTTLDIGIANDTNLESVTQGYWVQWCPWPGGCGYWYYVTRWFYGNKGDRLRLRASGGVFVDGYMYYTSSRDYKDNITYLCGETMQEALQKLEPVEFNFKGDTGKTTMGFIAESVPNLFGTQDQKGISPFEILTALVAEVKDQEKDITKLKKQVAAFKGSGK